MVSLARVVNVRQRRDGARRVARGREHGRAQGRMGAPWPPGIDPALTRTLSRCTFRSRRADRDGQTMTSRGPIRVTLLWLVLSVAAAVWVAIDRRPPEWDHANHLERAVDCYRSLRIVTDSGAREILEASSFYPPLVTCAAGLLYFTFPMTPLTAQAVMMGFLALALAAVYGLGRRLADEETGWWAAFLFGTAPFVLFSLTNFQLDLQIELEIGEREENEWRRPEQESRPPSGLLIGEAPAEPVDGGQGQGKEAHHHGLRRQGSHGEREVEEARRAGDEGRVERGCLEDLARAGVGDDPQAPIAVHGALEMVGMVPLGRPSVYGDPNGGGHRQDEPEQRDTDGASGRHGLPVTVCPS